MTRGEHTPGIVERLLPCPFCGSDSVGFKDTGLPDTLAGCNGCGATVPWKESRAEAIAAWNTRPEAADLISELVGALEKIRDKPFPHPSRAANYLDHIRGIAERAIAKARGGAE